MPATRPSKLPEALKATIARVAAFEGRTAHAVTVETLQAAKEDALTRQQFYVDGEASYQEALHTNTVFDGADVKAYVMARVKGGKPRRRKALPLSPAS